MWKWVIAGASAVVIAGSTFVYAQNREQGPRSQPRMEDMRAFADARLAALKAGLTLTPEQEKNWPAFEQAARDFQKLRLDRLREGVEARRSGRSRSNDPVARMEERATALSETGAALKKLADATSPLYNSLDDAQKRRFAILSRLGREDRARGEMRERMRRMDDGGPGFFRRGENESGDYMRGRGRSRDRDRSEAPIRGEERL
jgi:hypothetical protein